MTPSDAALLTRAERQLYRIRKENTRLKHALVAAQAEAALYKGRTEAWEARARLAEAANRSFTSPASGGGEKL